MGLKAGNKEATEGMSKAIFTKINEELSPSLEDLKAEDMEKVRIGWKKLAFAIAQGVVSHIKSDSEVKGVEIKIDETTYTQTNMVRVE